MSSSFVKLEVFGEVPLARFGHTITQGKFKRSVACCSYNSSHVVSKSKVILFGGATGDTGKYIITGDTYGLDLIGNKWSKLEGKLRTLLC
jgi:protein phosphatase